MNKFCLNCGMEFLSTGKYQKFCCKKCRQAYSRSNTRKCKNCGHVIKSKDKRLVYCSKECAKEQARKKRNERKREKYATDENYRLKLLKEYSEYCRSEQGKKVIQGHKLARDKRIKNTQNVNSHINLKDLYERDNGICWLCGGKCDWQDKELRTSENGRNYLATFGNYPSIDHIIPLSKFGTHTWENIRLAHKRCNIKRGNKT